MPALFWFRRDLRLGDHPALALAGELGSGSVLGVWIIDDQLAAGVGPTRAAYVVASLDALNDSMGGHLVVRRGRPEETLATLAKEVGASHIVATADYAPAGVRRDERVRAALDELGITLHLVDSPYVVTPGTVVNKAGAPCRVFSAFRRGWELEPRGAILDVPALSWITRDSLEPAALLGVTGAVRPTYFGDLPDTPAALPPAGEAVARTTLRAWANTVATYADTRNLPGVDGTSRLSPFLKVGAIHPRSVLAATHSSTAGSSVFASEICWREFYADVLWHHPESTWRNLQRQFDHLPVDRDEAAVVRFQRWARGETGYPLVDAGMRQLLSEGWMHNRVRMVCASFLVKHLHLDWRWGAAWFMWRLIDGDVASNQHGWQWTAGTGTDAAPYHRIFNPTLQAERFDAAGDYVHRWIPELRDVSAPQCLQPGGGTGLFVATGYAAPMIDASVERDEALRRFAVARAAHGEHS